MMNWKKMTKVLTIVGLALSLASCGGKNANGEKQEKSANASHINVITRENGSGTRGAFVEITGLLEKDGDSEKDTTSTEATVQNSTDGVMSTVANDKESIGYISLGSLNDKVKALKVESVEPTASRVASDEYKIARPFNLAFKGEIKGLARDFIDFIHSKEGQKIVEDNGYIRVKGDKSYDGKGKKGKLSIVGSTSVAPLMEKLKEAYVKMNPDVQVDITANGSSAGIQAAAEGTADIGMASRELKDEEKEKLQAEVMAKDGIAVIVNKENKLDNISLENLKKVFQGKLKEWKDLEQ